MFTGKTDEYLNTTLTNDSFFPDLSLGDFQRDYRTPAEFEQDTVERHLIDAAFEVNDELEDQRTEWMAAGTTELSQVGGDTIADQNELESLYFRAVYSRAKAELLQQLSSMYQQKDIEKVADTREPYELWMARSRRAIKKLLGKTSITVELI